MGTSSRPRGDPMDRGNRYERKFFLEHVDRREVERLVCVHPAFFREVFSPRYVNNIYLDTPDGSSYLDHVNGVATRHKLRIRWYGELTGRVERPVLEIKAKQGLVGCKRSYPLPPFTLDAAFDFGTLVENEFTEGLPGRLQLQLRCLAPSLINRYRRSYHLSGDGAFRITVDDRMSFGRPRPHTPLRADRFVESRCTIIELKYKASVDDRADRLASVFPFRVSRSSKYCYGIELLRALGN